MTKAVASDLTWGLLIATKDRLDALQVCVQQALIQTRPPTEVIVVDASADWQNHRDEIAKILADYPKIHFQYFAAALPSLTVQRNQALDKAQADIVFMIDDDSFLFPDCAARIMGLYEADVDGVVGGIQAALSDTMPPGIALAQSRKVTGGGSAPAKTGKNMFEHIRYVLRRHVFLMGMTDLFIPYQPKKPKHALPKNMDQTDARVTELFHGCRMTYRRHVITQSKYDDLLRYYCPGEDLDASYRVSLTHQLLTARQAKLHHYTISTGRIDRYRTTVLSGVNQAVLLARYGHDTGKVRRAYFRLQRRRLLAEFLKDLLSKRFSFPQLRGLLASRKLARQAFEMSPAELAAWYPDMQEKILKG